MNTPRETLSSCQDMSLTTQNINIYHVYSIFLIYMNTNFYILEILETGKILE